MGNIGFSELLLVFLLCCCFSAQSVFPKLPKHWEKAHMNSKKQAADWLMNWKKMLKQQMFPKKKPEKIKKHNEIR